MTHAPWILARDEAFVVDRNLRRTFLKDTALVKVNMLTSCNANGLEYYAESKKQAVVSLDCIILPLTHDHPDTNRFNYLGLAVTFRHLAGKQFNVFTLCEEKISSLRV